jgi:hypothetical protein
MYAATDRWPDETKPPTPTTSLRLRHAIAGLHAGVIGVFAMFAWVMIASLWHGRSIWVVPNLFSTTFFGSDAYRNQLLRTSWVGIALTVALYGSIGALWGCIWRDRRVKWLALYGVLTGLLVYFVFYDFVWLYLNPLVTLYAPDRQLEIGHMLWGLALARAPLYARRMSNTTAAMPVNAAIGDEPFLPPQIPPPSLPAPPPLPKEEERKSEIGEQAYVSAEEDAASPEIKSGEVIL